MNNNCFERESSFKSKYSAEQSIHKSALVFLIQNVNEFLDVFLDNPCSKHTIPNSVKMFFGITQHNVNMYFGIKQHNVIEDYIFCLKLIGLDKVSSSLLCFLEQIGASEVPVMDSILLFFAVGFISALSVAPVN